MSTSPLRTAGLLGLTLLLARCGGGGGGPSAPTPPVFYVANCQPADGDSDVALTARIVVTLSRAVDRATLSSDSVRVGIVGEGAPLELLEIVDGTADTMLRLTPVVPFLSSKVYAVLVSNSLKSVAGDAIGGPLQFLFRTKPTVDGGGVIPPTPSKLQPTTERMRQGRRSHTATLLNDGRVLLCGGYVAGTTVTDKGETFSTAGETFTLTSNRMVSPRASHAAVRLQDGRVLLCGGYYEASQGSLVSTSSAEIFSPVTGTFTAVGSMASERADHAVTLLASGLVLVTGGSRLVGQNIVDLSTVELFDPVQGTFSAAPHNLLHTHATHAVVDLHDGRFLVVGGSDTDLRPEAYTALGGVFTAISPAASDTGRFGAAVARYSDGQVAVVGGEAQGQVQNFVPSTTTLSNSGSPTSMPRAYATVSRIAAGQMLVAGGIDYTNLNYVEPSCDLIVEGGISGSSTYSTAVRFPTGMAFHTATVLLDGRILFAGGVNSTYGQPEFDGAYIYTP